MKLKLYLVPVLILAIIFGGIGLANVFGWWQPYVKRTSNAYNSGGSRGEGNVPSDITDPYDIRGSFSFLDIERNFDVSVEILAEAFPIVDKDFDEVLAQDLESHYEEMHLPYEIGTGSIKYFVAIYNNLHFDGEEALPDTAIFVLERDGKIEQGSIIGLKTDGVYTGVVSDEEENVHLELDEGEFSISGDTTVKEALEYGINIEDLEAIIGKIDDQNSLIKVVAEDNGFSFGKVKDSLNELIN